LGRAGKLDLSLAQSFLRIRALRDLPLQFFIGSYKLFCPLCDLAAEFLCKPRLRFQVLSFLQPNYCLVSGDA
jgi:hypothetical protein